MQSGFFTDKEKRVRPLTPTLSSFFGGATSDVEEAARRALLRKKDAAKRQRRISRAGVDPSSLSADSLNRYVEAARVKALGEFVERPKQTLNQIRTLDMKGQNQGLGANALLEMSPSQLAEQALLQKYETQNHDGWQLALSFLRSKLHGLTDEQLADLAEKRIADDGPSPSDLIVDHFLAFEARRRRKVVYGSYGPLKGFKRERKLKDVDRQLENAAVTLRSRIKNYVKEIDRSFASDVVIKPAKTPKPKYKRISIIAGNEKYLEPGKAPDNLF